MDAKLPTARADAAASQKRIRQLLGRAMLREADSVSRKLEEIGRQERGRPGRSVGCKIRFEDQTPRQA